MGLGSDQVRVGDQVPIQGWGWVTSLVKLGFGFKLVWVLSGEGRTQRLPSTDSGGGVDLSKR
ncbi:hypothetical protein KY290_022069 [Solanum tuberosum]|uniref:Uncharacterized protein n=1 Tax=Solanum tuberosum TaxID=4113 RepID=A0ABQ7V3C4_SOLTU|nr:hypothetical protein KY290_022069 [Solanum tuberosum]